MDLEKYRQLVASITDYAIYMLDIHGNVESWNPGAERFKGYTDKEIIGRHFSTFYTEEDRQDGLPARALKIAATEGRFENEGWRVRKDGGRFWAHVIIDPVRDPRGEVTGFAKITRDLSERKRAAQSLADSEQRFRLLVEGISDYAIYMLDPNGHVSSWNTGAQRFKGYTAEEIVGEHFGRFYTEEDRANGLPARALATAEHEGRFENEGWRLRKDGTRFWAHVIIDAVRDADGRHIGFAKITRDVTERRHADEELAEARTRLMQSQKLESIGQLTGGIAHDFNNLLTAVLGSLEILRRRLPSDPKFMRPLDNAMAGAQRGASLTQRLLAFARKQDLDIQAVDVVGVARGMADLLQSSTGSSIRIETQFPLLLSPAHTDANQLELAILNLVLNSRDAMPDGGKVVIAGAEHNLQKGNALDLPPGDYVCVSVIDAGEGMDAETLSRAFEPFYTTKGVGRGTGLGLPMVHGVAAQSGGRLHVTSRKGEGTTAEIWLPRSFAASEQGRGLPHQNIPAGGNDAALTILVVDDDPLVLRNTVVALEDLGHSPIEAASAKEALAILQERSDIDVLVTDQVMPDMTGLQLVERLASEGTTIPVILASGYAELPRQAVNLPRLQKPFTQAELAQAVHAVADTQPKGDTAKIRIVR